MTFENFLEEWRSDSPVICVKTSGSTGVPKTITLDKEFVRRSGWRTNSFFSITPDSRLHSCVAADYIGGKMMAVRAELAGCRFTWERPSNRPLEGIGRDERIDLLAVVASQMLHILDHLSDMPLLNAIIIGGSAIHPDLRKRIIASGLNAYETYGMTETASHIALRKIEEGSDLFFPLDGIEIDEDVRGCLVISFGPEGNHTSRMPDRGSFSNDIVVTNDMVEIVINSNGVKGFRIVGRYDNVIITGGKKVNPEDVERRIGMILKGDFLITSRPDEKWGERVVLRIARDKQNQEAQDDTILRNLKDILEPHEMPKEIEWTDELPRTPNGKLIRF